MEKEEIEQRILKAVMNGCPLCGEQMEPEECTVCGGEGYFDNYEEDPVNLLPGDEYEECFECEGRGFYLVCPNAPHKESEEKI